MNKIQEIIIRIDQNFILINYIFDFRKRSIVLYLRVLKVVKLKLLNLRLLSNQIIKIGD